MNGINRINNVNYSQNINLKKEGEETTAVTNPITQKNISMKGTEALAAYNYAMLNKDSALDMKVIKPLELPQDINDIKGEKIYDSEGNISAIIDDNENQHAEYTVANNKVVEYNIENKQTGETLYGDFLSEKWSRVTLETPDDKYYSTDYDENGNVDYISKGIYADRENDYYIDANYYADENSYNITVNYNEDGKRYHSIARFDKDKNCIEAGESTDGENTELRLNNGEPIGVTTSHYSANTFGIYDDEIDLNNLEPVPCPNYDLTYINSLNGEKTYYSNGQVEKLIAEDGNTYKFNYKGALTEIINDKWNALIGRDPKETDINKVQFVEITEKLENGAMKYTGYYYGKEQYCEIYYTDGNSKKAIFYKDGKLDAYYIKNGKHVKNYDFNEDGSIRNVIEGEYPLGT